MKRGRKSKRSTRALTLGLNRTFATKSKRSQLEISFSMLFSIILIIAFLAVAIYVIYYFMGLQGRISTKQFVLNVQEDVNGFWQATNSGGEQVVGPYSLPKKVEMVCFADLTKPGLGDRQLYDELKEFAYLDSNMFFYPFGSTEEDVATIEHLNMNETVKLKNPLCLQNNNGKISFVIERKYGEGLITIKENE